MLGIFSRLTPLLLLGALACGGQDTPPGPRSEPLPPPPPPRPDGPAATRPLLTAVEPAAWPSQGGIPLELVGQGFAPGALVTFGDVELAPPAFLSSTRLRLPLPPRPGAFGPVPLRVTNPDGQQSPVASLFSFSAAALELPQRSYTAGYRPRALAIADWNGDGQLDVAAAGSESNDVTLLFGDGSGGLEAAQPVPVGGAPYALVAADFNQDRVPDLALLQLASSTLSVLLGDGRGGFLLPQVFTDARIIRPVALAAADLNGDGAMDLAAASVGGADRVWLLLGDGRGRFPSSTLLSTGSDELETRGLALGDFNRDGKLDVATSNPAGNSVSLLLSDGAGGYLSPALVGTSSGPGCLASGDLDRDGRTDLVMGLSGDRIGVLLGNGTGGFRSAATFSSQSPPQGLALADMNADGRLDVVAAQNELSASLIVMLGNGAGGLGAPTALATSPGDAVAVADA